MGEEAPAEQIPLCPKWCVSHHDDESDEHQSLGRELAAHARPLNQANDAYETSLVFTIHRNLTDTTAWIYIGDGCRQGLDISVESAVGAIDILEAVLREAQ
ncbi:hypothetical protein D1871_23050 [Nakamurella silvestris]|nr:hypothetical protein D1871_23050 [Nakamurella silvestris]